MPVSRRATLAAMAACPFIFSPEASLAKPVSRHQTALEQTYLRWLSARNDIEETLTLYEHGTTRAIEEEVLRPLYCRAEELEDQIIYAPLAAPRDLAVKVLIAFATPEVISESAVDRIRSDAMRMVSLTDKA